MPSSGLWEKQLSAGLEPYLGHNRKHWPKQGWVERSLAKYSLENNPRHSNTESSVMQWYRGICSDQICINHKPPSINAEIANWQSLVAKVVVCFIIALIQHLITCAFFCLTHSSSAFLTIGLSQAFNRNAEYLPHSTKYIYILYIAIAQ